MRKQIIIKTCGTIWKMPYVHQLLLPTPLVPLNCVLKLLKGPISLAGPTRWPWVPGLSGFPGSCWELTFPWNQEVLFNDRLRTTHEIMFLPVRNADGFSAETLEGEWSLTFITMLLWNNNNITMLSLHTYIHIFLRSVAFGLCHLRGKMLCPESLNHGTRAI